jgi:glycine oxidase
MDDCDVAIIGAGIIGASIAFELSARGASVTVLDARSAGQGATQAAAGMLVPYLEGFGKPILAMAARSLSMYDEFVQRVSAESGLAVDYHRRGSLQVATREAEIPELHALEGEARAAGVRCTLLDAAQLRDLEPSLTTAAVAGALIPDHGVVLPTSLLNALTAAATRRGASFTTERRVERVVPRAADGFELQTSRGPLLARRVVVAGGAWSSQLAIDGIPPLPVRPVRGQLVNLTSPGPPLRTVLWGPRCYVAPSSDGRLSVGATMEDAGFEERATAAGVRDLLDAATALVPALSQASFLGVRVGLRPAAPDDMPVIGRSGKYRGLFYATGHFRNGILLAPLTGRVVADLVLETCDDAPFAAASPQRFGEY